MKSLNWKIKGIKAAPYHVMTFMTALLLLATCWPALGANLLDRVNQQEITQVVRLKAGHSKVLRTAFVLTRISVADPDIADLIL
ncbi:MAG: pilus assembly protein N-terminal domain-containing protein, partial [Syntrophobacterales bacterium]|nr:pilus assembly protein N-terminal domain-containing protein [Syntrophobacterales bacterium]